MSTTISLKLVAFPRLQPTWGSALSVPSELRDGQLAKRWTRSLRPYRPTRMNGT